MDDEDTTRKEPIREESADVGAAESPPLLAIPVDLDPSMTREIPVALPVPQAIEVPFPQAEEYPQAIPVFTPDPSGDRTAPALPKSPAPTISCSACGAIGEIGQSFCLDCGFYFQEPDLAPETETTPSPWLKEKYELCERISERSGIVRFRGLDHGAQPPLPIIAVRQPLPPELSLSLNESTGPDHDRDSSLVETIHSSNMPAIVSGSDNTDWPSIAWDRKLLQKVGHPALPTEVDYFCDESHEYLIMEVPTGASLWDSWDAAENNAALRFGYLHSLAELFHQLHQASAMFEYLRPDQVVIDEEGRLRITDTGSLLSLPFSPGTPIRGSLYSAPEFLSSHQPIDPRAALYCFGAIVYALHVGRDLNERTDFDGPGIPKPFLPRFPDVNPAFGRLIQKTFNRNIQQRFPIHEGRTEDETGFRDLLLTLDDLKHTQGRVRLEVASWTSTGMTRAGNEDAYAVLHSCESRQENLGEACLIILCDGMGGYEAGEVAASLTLQSVRNHLLKLKPFQGLAGAPFFTTDPLAEVTPPGGHPMTEASEEQLREAIGSALKEANRLVFSISRAPGSTRRGMGCTAEVVYLDGRRVMVGHVGDSRTYLLHKGQLVQLTRDQTLVNRLVELGTLSASEAASHPRRHELQQAVGGQPDVEPGFYCGELLPGDWVVVCSDGLTNHISCDDIQQMLLSEATSAEMAARRLINLTLIEGANDNVTVVAVRAS
ncbi:MAG: protein kinase domain-containing protein [Gemmataceae bacterium]